MALVVLIAVALVVVIGVAAGVATASSQEQFVNSIKIENLMSHLKVLLCIYFIHSVYLHVHYKALLSCSYAHCQ